MGYRVDAANAVVDAICEVQIAGPIHCETRGQVDGGLCGRDVVSLIEPLAVASDCVDLARNEDGKAALPHATDQGAGEQLAAGSLERNGSVANAWVPRGEGDADRAALAGAQVRIRAARARAADSELSETGRGYTFGQGGRRSGRACSLSDEGHDGRSRGLSYGQCGKGSLAWGERAGVRFAA